MALSSPLSQPCAYTSKVLLVPGHTGLHALETLWCQGMFLSLSGLMSLEPLAPLPSSSEGPWPSSSRVLQAHIIPVVSEGSSSVKLQNPLW